MRRIVPFLLCVVSLTAFAQNRSFKISWSDPVTSGVGTTTIKLPSFGGENYVDQGDGTIAFQASWKDRGEADSSTLRIINAVYEDVAADALFDIDVTKLLPSLDAVLRSNRARGQYYTSIWLHPIISSNGRYRRLVSFDITYSYNNSLQRTGVTRSGLTNFDVTSSVLSSGEWFKFYVEETGVYRIDRGFLNALGVNTSQLDPRNIRIYGNGGRMIPLLNSEVEYLDVQENAIWVSGEEDGSFDAEDFVLFYAEGSDQWNEESQTHRNIFADRTFYYLTTSHRVCPWAGLLRLFSSQTQEM